MKKKERLIYLPLGGAGEIGMNMYLYGYGENGKESFIIIDVGVAFPDMESTPGVDLIMANPKFIEENKERLVMLIKYDNYIIDIQIKFEVA